MKIYAGLLIEYLNHKLMSEERIKAIIKSRGWSDYRVESVEDKTLEEKLSTNSYMWQILKNGGSLFIKDISGEAESGMVSVDSNKPEMTPYKYTIIIGVGKALFGRVFNVFIGQGIIGEKEKFKIIYFSSDMNYVNENIERILNKVVKPEYYSEKTTIEQRYNYGLVQSSTGLKFPTINSKYSVEEQLARKHKDNEDCLNKLQELVQEKIVPIDPVLIIGKLHTIDKAIKYYIELLETENRELKKNSSNIN